MVPIDYATHNSSCSESSPQILSSGVAYLQNSADSTRSAEVLFPKHVMTQHSHREASSCAYRASTVKCFYFHRVRVGSISNHDLCHVFTGTKLQKV